MIVALTGHRSEKLDEANGRLFARISYDKSRPDTVITGMANGFDLWAGHEAMAAGIPIVAAVPFRDHKSRVVDKALYLEIIEYAKEVVYVYDKPGYPGAWVYQKRNEWMVDHAERLLACWDGSGGGTANCVKYALGKIPIKRYNPQTGEITYETISV